MSAKVEVSVEEIKRVYNLIEEMNEFFHQPYHYSQVDDFAIKIYPELRQIYYHVVWEWLPDNIKQEIEDR